MTKNLSRSWRQQQAVAMFLLMLCLVIVSPAAVFAQNQSNASQAARLPSTATPSPKDAHPSWSVRVFPKQNPVTVRLHAANASLSKIVAEIGRQLNVPIILSTVMKQQRVTFDLNDVPLEIALRSLAPEVRADMMLSGGGATNNQPKYAAIYLSGINETPWENYDASQNNSQAMLIEGDTNDLQDDAAIDTTKKDGEKLVEASFAKNRLTLRAHRQPLSVVLYEAARAMKIPFDIQRRSDETIDTEFADASIEQALTNLPASVHLYLRKDLATMESTPLRLVLAGESNTNKVKP